MACCLTCWACSGDGAGIPAAYRALRVPDGVLESADARHRGEALYREHCVLCHGERLDGRGVRREGLSPAPPDFRSASWQRRTSPVSVFATIRDGRGGSAMPAWPTFSDGEVWALVSYIRAAGVSTTAR